MLERKTYPDGTTLTPREAVRYQHDGTRCYSFAEYVRDIVQDFGATQEEAEAVVRVELKC